MGYGSHTIYFEVDGLIMLHSDVYTSIAVVAEACTVCHTSKP